MKADSLDGSGGGRGPGKQFHPGGRNVRISPTVYKIQDVCAMHLLHAALASGLGSGVSTPILCTPVNLIYVVLLHLCFKKKGKNGKKNKL